MGFLFNVGGFEWCISSPSNPVRHRVAVETLHIAANTHTLNSRHVAPTVKSVTNRKEALLAIVEHNVEFGYPKRLTPRHLTRVRLVLVCSVRAKAPNASMG